MSRRRKHNPNIPDHIDQSKIPTNCYWNNSGRGHWYTTYKDETGRQHTQRLAGRDALLSELHRIIEEYNGINRDAFGWMAEQFHQSTQFKQLAAGTRRDYEYCLRIVRSHPTRIGIPLGEVAINRWNSPMVQKLVDQLARSRGPSTANHVLRYLSRVFRWGKNRGYCLGNPAQGIETAVERKRQRLPNPEVLAAVTSFAQERGQRMPRIVGACPYYLWIVMEIAYLCRLRGIEVITLTDANETAEGLLSNRRKGSRDNITAWNPRLRAAWDAAVAYRGHRQVSTPMRPESRSLIVGDNGQPIKKSSLDSAWQRLMKLAIREGVITLEQRFSLHDLKRRGTTDTPGTRAEKQDATGHKSEKMLDIYDKEIKLVKPASD